MNEHGLKRTLLVLPGLAVATLAAPVLAGLGAQGWPMIAVLAAAWLFAQVLGKPWIVPNSLDPAVLGRFGVLAATQAVLVLVLYGAGAGVAALSGWRPDVPLWLPPAMALGAAVLARAVWTPMPPAMEAVLDDALGRMQGLVQDAEGREAAFDPDLRPVADLPPDTPDSVAEAAVAAAMEHHETDWFDASERLIRLLDTGQNRAGRRGLILWGTDPARVASGRFGYPMCHAWQVTWTDPEMLGLYAARALPVVRARPDLWEGYPRASVVEMAIDAGNGAAVNGALRDLADALRAAAPEGAA